MEKVAVGKFEPWSYKGRVGRCYLNSGNNWFFTFFWSCLKNTFLLIFRARGRAIETDTSMRERHPLVPFARPLVGCPQPGHVSKSGIESLTSWFVGWCSTTEQPSPGSWSVLMSLVTLTLLIAVNELKYFTCWFLLHFLTQLLNDANSQLLFFSIEQWCVGWTFYASLSLFLLTVPTINSPKLVRSWKLSFLMKNVCIEAFPLYSCTLLVWSILY